MDKEFGYFLRSLRGTMSLREASKKSGLSHTYIRDLELNVNRKTNAPIIPSPETLKRLANAYDYPYDRLLKESGIISENNNNIFTESEKKIINEKDLSVSKLKDKYHLVIDGEDATDEDIEELIRVIKTWRTLKKEQD